jgi:hypothetical protein
MSDNPKTIANHKSIQSKVGLDISDYRADAAFCASKSHKLQALPRDPQWASWSEEKKQAMERNIIRQLEVKRDERKRKAEISLIVDWEKSETQAKEELIGGESENEEKPLKKHERRLGSVGSVEEAITGGEVEPSSSVTAEDEYDLKAKAKSRRDKKKKRKSLLKPKEKVLGDDDSGWTSDDNIDAILWEVKKQGAEKFFEELSKLEVKAEKSYAELAEAVGRVDEK